MTELPGVTYVHGTISLRLLDIRLTDFGAVDLEAHLGEAVEKAVLEFFAAAQVCPDDIANVDLVDIEEVYGDLETDAVREEKRTISHARFIAA